MELLGKWALITGSSRGIGQQIAIALAKRGCDIVIHGRTAENCTETQSAAAYYGAQTYVIGSPVDSESGVQAIIDFVKHEIGTPDFIFNNAGIQNEWTDTFANSIDVWKEQFQVNLFSAVQICNAFLPSMIERKSGVVVNVTSDIEGVPEMASYGSAKWAVRKMTSEFAVALDDSGVTIAAMDPGWIRTDLGGPEAPNAVESVIPGALAPLVPGLVRNGTVYSAQLFFDEPKLQF